VQRPQNPIVRLILPPVMVTAWMFVGNYWLFGQSFTRAVVAAICVGLMVATVQWWTLRRAGDL
jgi:membrane protein CcdC involved in cytochrome C biogenesis